MSSKLHLGSCLATLFPGHRLAAGRDFCPRGTYSFHARCTSLVCGVPVSPTCSYRTSFLLSVPSETGDGPIDLNALESGCSVCLGLIFHSLLRQGLHSAAAVIF